MVFNPLLMKESAKKTNILMLVAAVKVLELLIVRLTPLVIDETEKVDPPEVMPTAP